MKRTITVEYKMVGKIRQASISSEVRKREEHGPKGRFFVNPSPAHSLLKMNYSHRPNALL